MNQENTINTPRPSRWSSKAVSSLEIPSYVPPEALVLEDGAFMRGFLLRVASIDLKRILDQKNLLDSYFSNCIIEPEYDGKGKQINTPEQLLQMRRNKIMDDLSQLLKVFREKNNQNIGLNPGKKEIVFQRYFSPEEVANGAYGALLGARGMVHQDLERTTKCKIILAGRGITNVLKDTSSQAAKLAQSEPHARILAPNEKALQIAVERIEWILSDDPLACEFREKNKIRTAQIDGRYDPLTWSTQTSSESKISHTLAKREREDNSQWNGGDENATTQGHGNSMLSTNEGLNMKMTSDDELDDDVRDFLNDF